MSCCPAVPSVGVDAEQVLFPRLRATFILLQEAAMEVPGERRLDPPAKDPRECEAEPVREKKAMHLRGGAKGRPDPPFKDPREWEGPGPSMKRVSWEARQERGTICGNSFLD